MLWLRFQLSGWGNAVKLTEQAVSLVLGVIHWTVDLPLREMMNSLVVHPGPRALLSLSAVCSFTFSSHSITVAAIG